MEKPLDFLPFNSGFWPELYIFKPRFFKNLQVKGVEAAFRQIDE